MDRREFLAAMATVPALAPLQPRPIPGATASSPITSRRQGPACPVPIPGAWSRSTPRVHRRSHGESRRAHRSVDDRARDDDADGRQGPARQLGAVLQRPGLRRHQDQRSGAPGAMSMPEVVAEIASNLIAVGVKPTNIVIHERGGGQILLPNYDQFVPAGVRVESANTWLGFDPGRLRGSELLRRGRYALVPAPHGHRTVHEDHQRAEHEGPRRRRA